jgi:Uma2 family endonuclease
MIPSDMTQGARRTGIRAADLLRPGPWPERSELWDGVLCVHDPTGGWSGAVGGRVFARLAAHVDVRALGWTLLPEQGYWVSRDPDRVLVPDASYVSRARLPRVPHSGFIEVAPDFAVEIRSPSDRWTATLEKCGVWTAHGVPVVWAIDPEQRLVVAFRGLDPPLEARPGDEVDAAPALPDFRVPVAALFEGLE